MRELNVLRELESVKRVKELDDISEKYLQTFEITKKQKMPLI